MSLDSNQLQAIQVHKGPALILAGPGSGKTTVITHRICHLIRECQVPAGSILVITFTKAAASEMKERFLQLMDGESASVTFGTFHAVFFTILKHAYGYTSKNIVKEEYRHAFVREYIHRLRLEYEDENDFIASILGEISAVKNTGIPLEHYYATSCAEEVFRRIYSAYEEFLHQNRLLDFDDMLVYCKELLEQRPDILKAWQHKFQYILIDEFQDINQIQYDIIRMLAAPENNLFIVGDDDQSIYRFRGAKPEIMQRFQTDYPDAKQILLDTNYRSGREIVAGAGKLISRNKIRFPKQIHAFSPEGVPVQYQEFPKQREQNEYVIETMRKLHEQDGMKWNDMAVLFRTNSQPRLFIQQLMDVNIPFLAKDTIPNIYDHWVSQDILTYMKLAVGDRRRRSFLQVMNRPVRYLSRESLPYESVAFDVWIDYYKDQQWMVQRIEKLQQDLQVVSRMRPYSAINYIRKAVGYEEFVKEFAKERKLQEEDYLDVLDELQDTAKGFLNFEEWFHHIKRTKEEWKEKASSANQKPEDAVSICTLHSAKGLEYDTVFILDVNEKVMPYKKAVLEADLEEERRMFYVGMTRAKRQLYICWSKQINNKEMSVSRFVVESSV